MSRSGRTPGFLAQAQASERWLKWCAALLVLVGLFWTGWSRFDQTYARAADVRQQVDGLKALYLQQRISDLEREEYGFQREAKRRRLTDFEQDRLNKVQRELHYLRQQLQPIQPGKQP